MGREGREEGQAFLRARRGRWGKESADTKRKRRRVSPAASEGRYQYTQDRDSYIFVLEEM